MSSNYLWLISHSTETNASYRAKNRRLAKKITELLRKHKASPEEVAEEIRIPHSRARNWYFRYTKISALDLLRLGMRFEGIREFVMETIDSSSD